MKNQKIMSTWQSQPIPQRLENDLGIHTKISLTAKTKKRLKTIARFMQLRNELLEHSAHTENAIFAANAQRIAGLWDEAVSNALITLGSRVACQGAKHE